MNLRKFFVIGTLMLIGEFIFLLPFVLTRIFRPTFLTVFQVNNFQLGSAFSVYGIVAMISYFLGGPLADRFSPRKLLPVAFIATAFGGVALTAIPNVWTLSILYGWWGLTTILLFWAGYVKAQREFGGEVSQGKAFGMVDAGRGFVAAFIASTSVFLLDGLLPVSADFASKSDYTFALRWIIIIFTIITTLGAVLSWIFLQDGRGQYPKISLDGIKSTSKRPTVWSQAIIVLAAYVGYKCTDDFSLYAKDAFGYNDVNAAHMATVSFWMRPLAAILAGFLGDKFIHSRVVFACFIIMFLGSLVIASGILRPGFEVFIILTIASISVGIYGLRGLYYALFQESALPMVFTGSAAGLVSVIGYTPDIFMGPLMGIILDSNPGEMGHQYLFALLALFSIVGMIATNRFRKYKMIPDRNN